MACASLFASGLASILVVPDVRFGDVTQEKLRYGTSIPVEAPANTIANLHLQLRLLVHRRERVRGLDEIEILSSYFNVLIQGVRRKRVLVEAIQPPQVPVFLPIGDHLVEVDALSHRHAAHRTFGRLLRDACERHGHSDLEKPSAVDFLRLDVGGVQYLPPNSLRR